VGIERKIGDLKVFDEGTSRVLVVAAIGVTRPDFDIVD